MKTTLPPLLRPVVALLLLAACDTPAEKAERAELNSLEAQTRSTYAASDIEALYARIEKLEENDKLDSANIGTLFKSRDAMSKLNDAEAERINKEILILFENDKRINPRLPNPAQYQER